MDSSNPAVATGSGQPGLGVTRSDDVENPWRKSCVLTLDGGGIRGYASLWILKILMEAIEKIEKEQPEPHESSFEPRVEETDTSNGYSRTAGTEAVGHPPPRARTNSTLESRRTNRPFKRPPNESRHTEPRALDNLGTDDSCSDEGFLPCHYFDYIAGTSTGGLNAIMLGRLRMSVDDCLGRYPEMARNVFSGKKKSKFKRIATLTNSKYDSNLLEAEIRKIVEYKAPPNAQPRQEEFDFDTYHSPEDLCKTVVVAIEDDGKAEKPYLFRTYSQPHTGSDVKNPGPADTNEIWRVARATSAAPTYFDPIRIENKEYSDGGVGNNNPVQLMLREVTAKANIESYNDAFGVIVSIGAGHKPTTRLRVKHRFPGFSSLKPVKELSKFLKRLKDNATEVDKAHEWVSTLMEQIKFRHYYRWTGGEDVGGLAMDEWHSNPKGNHPTTARFIEDRVKEYMKQQAIRTLVQDCARELVTRRRARIAHQPDHGLWRRHAYCTLVPCPYCLNYFVNRAVVKRHIENSHPKNLTPDINLDSLVKLVPEVHPWCRGGPL